MPSVRDRMTPLLGGGGGGGGVAHVPAFLPRPKREGFFKADNHSGMRHLEESGFATP